MKTITFKSIPDNWNKEFAGIKPNTTRFVDDWDEDRWDLFFTATHIEIINTKTNDTFRRKIVDKTQFPEKKCVVVSWKDE